MKTRTSTGGTFGCWTCKAMQHYLTIMTAGDAKIEPTRTGYRVTDAHRPGYEANGKTPREAATNAGFWVPARNTYS